MVPFWPCSKPERDRNERARGSLALYHELESPVNGVDVEGEANNGYMAGKDWREHSGEQEGKWKFSVVQVQCGHWGSQTESVSKNRRLMQRNGNGIERRALRAHRMGESWICSQVLWSSQRVEDRWDDGISFSLNVAVVIVSMWVEFRIT